MSEPPPPVTGPDPPLPSQALRGLDEASLALPARQLLASLPWQGAPLDPDALPAADFLALL